MTNDKHQKTDIRAQNIGIVGDHAHVEGGIHFYGRPPDYHAPFQPPPLPPHFIPRPEISDALKPRLLAEETPTPGVLVVSAIHGLGGIGKSVLAAALAHDPEVQARFPDGVLWATLGQQPDLLSLLSDWVQALGDYDFRPTTVEAASTHLRTLLHDQAALLVVDDVWDPDHALPFKTGGPRCQVLITTRRADVADEVGADLYQLDVMTPEQSLGLVAARLGRSLEETERDQALCLAKALGYLPLALELAAARIARGVTWQALRQALEEEIARLEALEGPRRKTRPRLEASFHLSLDALRAENEQAWRAFAWLGVLPEDVAVTAPLATTLWEMDRATAAETLELLWNDALLLPGSPVRIGEAHWPSYRLHDLLHDSARRLLTAPPEPRRAGDLPGLGLTLPAAHAHLLARYRAQTQDDLWHTLADDGYVHAHLAFHLERAGWADELHALLLEETPAGRNGWYEARERLGQTAGFLSDLDRAWHAAEKADAEAIASGAMAPHLGDQVRCALCQASVNSLAANVLPELLAALVENRMWTPAQGLTYAHQSPDEQRRVEALAGLAPHLPAELLGEALAAARDIEDEEWRARALAGLAPYLPPGLLGEALAAARGIENEYWQAEALAGLAPHLPAELMENALAAARKLSNQAPFSSPRAAVLAIIVPHLPVELMGEALVTARSIASEWRRANVLAELTPHLPAELMGETLAAARGIADEGRRVKVLAELSPHLPAELMGEALVAARGISDNESRANVLAALVPHLPAGERDAALAEALAAARDLPDPKPFGSSPRVEALTALAPHLPPQLLGEALAAARDLPEHKPFGSSPRAEALTALAPHLPPEERKAVLAEALAAVRGIADGYWQNKTLIWLAPYLPAGEREVMLLEALTVARGLPEQQRRYGISRMEALAWLVPHLPAGEREAALAEALEAARGIKHKRWRVSALAQLSHQLAELGYYDQALAAARGIVDDKSRTAALAELMPYLPVDLLIEAVTQEIENNPSRAAALVGLAPHPPIELVGEALTAAQELPWRGLFVIGNPRMKALVDLLPHLPAGERESALAKALVAARDIEDESSRAGTLVDLAPHLPAGERESALAEALAAARDIAEEWEQVSALTELVPHLPAGERELVLAEALVAARGITYVGSRAYTLTALAPHLPAEERESVLVEALAAARGMEDDVNRREALVWLALRLAELGYYERALALARSIEDQEDLAEALVELVPHLPVELVGKALAAAGEIWDEWSRAEALVGLAPHLPAGLLREALAAARGIADDRSRAKALTALAPRLAAFPHPELARLWLEEQEGANLLHYLSRRTRRDLLADMAALVLLIHALGGEQAIAETFRAIQDVGRWWP